MSISTSCLTSKNDLLQQRSLSVGYKRIVFVGASYKFVHKVLRDMLIVGGFGECELVLHDIHEEPLRIVGDLLEKIIQQSKSKITLRRTLDKAEALKDADVVILSITTGGLEADVRTWEVCEKHNIPVGIGDTLGPPALSRNLRSIPVVLDLARRMEQLCPEAVLLNFTNPMSALTAAINQHTSIQAIGLCHSGDELYAYFAKVFNCDKDDIDMVLAGVNHQSFVMRLSVNGIDYTHELLEKTKQSDALLEDNLLTTKHESVALQQEVCEQIGYWPSTGETHLAEFYPFHYSPLRINEFSESLKHGSTFATHSFGPTPCPEIIHRWTYGPGEVEDLDLLTTEHAHEIMWSMFTHTPYTRVLNVSNQDDVIRGISPEACVEVIATVQGCKITAEPIDLPPVLLDLVHRWTTIHQLSIEAAVKGDRAAAQQALFLDPHILDNRVIPEFLTDLTQAIRPWLSSAW